MFKRYAALVEAHKVNDLCDSQPTKGNIEGGLTTIEEKALGNIQKIGKKCLVDGVLDKADAPTGPGLWFMDKDAPARRTGLETGGDCRLVRARGRQWLRKERRMSRCSFPPRARRKRQREKLPTKRKRMESMANPNAQKRPPPGTWSERCIVGKYLRTNLESVLYRTDQSKSQR